MKYTLQQYRAKQVSGLDFVKDHFLSEGDKGEVEAIEIRPNRFLYAIKRVLRDYDDIEYAEFKVYDLDNPKNSCIDKKKSYDDDCGDVADYFNFLMKFDSEFKNYVESRLEYGD